MTLDLPLNDLQVTYSSCYEYVNWLHGFSVSVLFVWRFRIVGYGVSGVLERIWCSVALGCFSILDSFA